jgi:hypothetical protein
VNDSNGLETEAVATREEIVALDLTLQEANGLRAWLLKPASDGSTALDDVMVGTAMKKLGAAIDRIEAVANVRRELDEAGFDTADMGDEQVAELGRRIGQVSQRALR